jgi:RNA polymerase sigma factor (sigma-70 family)
MSTGEILTDVIQHLRAQLGDTSTDLELLTRYAQRRDEAAFTALVRRHGGLVLGAARRQLADLHQAEDVFQATFLALARSAGRLGRPTSLANWLYTVARRQARKARIHAARRSALERTQAPRPDAAIDPLTEITGRELVCLIDEELARLPEVYRLPLLLCCVEGLSREEAARQLGWSDGAVKGRLERGRRQLAARLAKRGVAPSALLFTSLAASALPNDLIARTTGLAASPWSKSIPAAVLALATEGPTKLLSAVVRLGLLLAVGFLGVAAISAQKEPMSSDPPSPVATAQRMVKNADDPLPTGSILRFGTTRFRHGTAIEGLAVSADDRFAVVASGNHWLGSTRAFDLATGRVLYTVNNNGYFHEAIALSPDGRTLATKQNNTVHVRDAATGQEQRTLELPTANPRTITQWLTFSPDGKTVAVAAEGKEIHLVEMETGTLSRSLHHSIVVFAVAFSPDGRLLASGGYDNDQTGYFFRLWEVGTGKELRRFTGLKQGIRTLAFSPDGTLLASGGDDAQLRLWEVASGKVRRAFPADGAVLRSVAFTPNGQTVAAAADSIRLYDVATGQQRQRIDRTARALHVSADGKTLTGAVAGAIYRWDTATGRPLTPDSVGDSAVDQIAVSSDGRRVVTRDQSSTIHVWDAVSGKHRDRFRVAFQRGFALSPEGRFLAWPVEDPSVKFPDIAHPNWLHEGHRLRLYDLVSGRMLDRFPAFKGDAHDLTFSPDGQTLVTVDHQGAWVRTWDVATGKEQHTFQALRDGEKKGSLYVARTALSPDGRTLAVAHHRADNTTLLFGQVVVRLWDLKTDRELHELTGHINQVLDLAFSSDSRLLVTCGEYPGALGQGGVSLADRTFVWDVATGNRVVALPEGLRIGAGNVAFSPDGRTLATASADGVIRLWEMASWTVRAEFRGHRDRVSALMFASNGKLLSGSMDTTVLAWDLSPPLVTTGPLPAAWDDLLRPEAPVAFRAQGRLRAAPTEAVSLFATRLKPVEAVDAKRLAALIGDLDNPEFTTREQAMNTLKELGRSAARALQEAREKSASAEVRRRAGQLLAEIERTVRPPEELRGLRAIETLEWIGTPEARHVLAKLAKGDPGAALTRAAEGTLKRLLGRP